LCQAVSRAIDLSENNFYPHIQIRFLKAGHIIIHYEKGAKKKRSEERFSSGEVT
jgi:hypothetical protein